MYIHYFGGKNMNDPNAPYEGPFKQKAIPQMSSAELRSFVDGIEKSYNEFLGKGEKSKQKVLANKTGYLEGWPLNSLAQAFKEEGANFKIDQEYDYLTKYFFRLKRNCDVAHRQLGKLTAVPYPNPEHLRSMLRLEEVTEKLDNWRKEFIKSISLLSKQIDKQKQVDAREMAKEKSTTRKELKREEAQRLKDEAAAAKRIKHARVAGAKEAKPLKSALKKKSPKSNENNKPEPKNAKTVGWKKEKG